MTKKQRIIHCPDKKTINLWVRNGPDNIDSDVFQHLLHCDQCRDKWFFELEYQLYKDYADKYVPTEEDIKSVKDFLAQMHEEEQWKCLTDNFGSRYNRVGLARLNSIENTVLRSVMSFGLFPAMGASGNNVNQRLYSSGSDELVIVFIATCPENDPRYWKAELTIPPEITPETVLSIFITDSKKRPIESGNFILVNQEIPIENGIAELGFEQFIMNLHCHTVKLIFDDKQEIKGTLRFF